MRNSERKTFLTALHDDKLLNYILLNCLCQGKNSKNIRFFCYILTFQYITYGLGKAGQNPISEETNQVFVGICRFVRCLNQDSQDYQITKIIFHQGPSCGFNIMQHHKRCVFVNNQLERSLQS